MLLARPGGTGLTMFTQAGSCPRLPASPRAGKTPAYVRAWRYKHTILMNGLAEGQTVPQTSTSRDVLPLQPAHAAGLSGGVPVLPVPGDAVQEVHRQPAAAARPVADYPQHRRGRIDLAPRGVGRRGVDGARPRRRLEGEIPQTPAVPVDDH